MCAKNPRFFKIRYGMTSYHWIRPCGGFTLIELMVVISIC